MTLIILTVEVQNPWHKRIIAIFTKVQNSRHILPIKPIMGGYWPGLVV